MIGGAWPFLVRGVICLLNCVSLKDLTGHSFWCAIAMLRLTGLTAQRSVRLRLSLGCFLSSARPYVRLYGSLARGTICELLILKATNVTATSCCASSIAQHKLEGPLLLFLNQRKVAAITGL